MLTYKLTESQDKGITVSVFVNGRNYVYTENNHTAFFEMLDSLRSYAKSLKEGGELVIKKAYDGVLKYLKPEYLAEVAKTNLKLEFRDGALLFDGKPLAGPLADKVVRFYERDLPYEYLFNFVENLMNNPDARSREQLYAFLERYDFPITPDGHFLAYKGLRKDGTSVHSGFGIVNGKVYNDAHLPNEVGSVITMPRHKVNANPNEGCSFGLHVGTLQYVKGFSEGRMVIVKVNPRDVVSVPADSSFQKVRCCQYEVVSLYTDEIKEDVVETTSSNLESLVRELADSTITNEYHLTNRVIKRLHPDSEGVERKNYFDEILPIAQKVLGIEQDEYEDEDEDVNIPQEYIELILKNAHTIFPADNLWHFTGRIMNARFGRGKWQRDSELYDSVLDIAEKIYNQIDIDVYYDIDKLDFTSEFQR